MSTLAAQLQRPTISRRSTPLAAAALLAVALVHLIDGPASLDDQLYVGALELALAAAAVPLAVLLLVAPVRRVWAVVGALNLLALAVFVASRTVGLPGATDDIGNWGQTLGLVNVATELAVISLAAHALRRGPAA
jgi:hypothetical protein